MNTCSACKHYRQTNGPKGQCRHSPPAPLIVGFTKEGPAIGSAYPPVAGNFEACGQFDKKLVVKMELDANGTLPEMPPSKAETN